VTMPIIRTEARRLYKCDCCGRSDVWSDSWAWFGSFKQLDDEGMKGVKPVMTMCSAECRVMLIAADRLPHKGLDDAGNVIDDDRDDKPPSRRRASLHPSQVDKTP
jgi:hypothetical protein